MKDQEFVKFAYVKAQKFARQYPNDSERYGWIAWLIYRDDMTSETYCQIRREELLVEQGENQK